MMRSAPRPFRLSRRSIAPTCHRWGAAIFTHPRIKLIDRATAQIRANTSARPLPNTTTSPWPLRRHYRLGLLYGRVRTHRHQAHMRVVALRHHKETL